MNFEDDIVIKELIERLKKKQIIPFVGFDWKIYIQKCYFYNYH